MNERNVSGLTALLYLAKRSRWDIGSQKFLPSEERREMDTGDLARFLAHAGVLAPQALTDDEITDAVYAGINDAYDVEPMLPEKIRAELERIAKGEV